MKVSAKNKKRKTPNQRLHEALIFIDTNVLLDFYRMHTKGESVNWLQKIDDNHHKIITTCQVEMEFKKNRQKVLSESISKFKIPDFQTLNVPIFMADETVSKTVEEKKFALKNCVTKLKKKMENWLKDPEKNDEIYKSLQRLFKSKSEYRLNRDHKERRLLKHKARTRSILGYPPKKKDDSTIGDALNWEWIIYCAKNSTKDIILVTRDSDYFQRIDSTITINTWLAHEFKDRVSQQRKIYLYDNLSEAFKKVGIKVSSEEEDSENQLSMNDSHPS